jgi:membrane protein YdbS with pleckstrin-like domain
MNTNIPKKFQKADKSFLDSLTSRSDSTFIPFPKDSSFHGREDGENIILVVRSHWILYLPHLIGAFLVLMLPWLLIILIPSLISNSAIFISLLIIALLICISVITNAYLSWYYNVSIITDQRIIDLDFPNIMSHTMSEIQLDKIQDVTDKQIGAMGSFFDIGSVFVQTAGSNQDVEFQNIPRPRDVHDILSDLLEMQEKGEL